MSHMVLKDEVHVSTQIKKRCMRMKYKIFKTIYINIT